MRFPAVVLLLATAGCGGGDAAEGPYSAVLITLDTTRADALGSYGRTTGVTPHLDRLRERSLQYDPAYTVAPLTLPSHASMLTGLYPPRHGVRDNGLWALPDSAETVAEAARDAGYDTAAFLASSVLGPRFGLDQGFATYEAPGFAGQLAARHAGKLPAGDVVDGALAWLSARDGEKPFFLWVHLFDPHSPYRPRPEFQPAMRANASYPNVNYLAEVAYMDRELGRLLDAIDLDELVVVTVADHGESLRAHGETSHGAFCYQETLRVPLYVSHPDGRRAGERSSEIVSVVDVHPTLAEAMGLALASSVDGRSLLSREPSERGVYFECYSGFLSYGWSPIAGWLDGEGKYLHSSAPELYDLRSDPGEQRDLAAERAGELERYRRAIADVADLPALEVTAGEALDDAAVAELRSLGYAGAGLGPDRVPHPLAATGLPAPAAMRDAFETMQAGIRDCGVGRFAEAEAAFREVLARNPRNYTAVDMLSFSLMEQGRHAEAIPHLQWLVREGPERPGYLFNLGVCLQKEGRWDEAIAVLERAAELAPDLPRFREQLERARRAASRNE